MAKSKSAQYYDKNPKSKAKKDKYNKEYNKKTVDDRVDRNRKRREGQAKGLKGAQKGSGKDFDHAKGKFIKASINRGRNSKNGGTAGDRRARG